MDSYTLNTVNYNYKTLSHEGFGGVCKYIATPKRIGYSRLLVKHENIQSPATPLCAVGLPNCAMSIRRKPIS